MINDRDSILKAIKNDRRILWLFVVLMMANALLFVIMAVDEPSKTLRLWGSGLTTISMGFFVYSMKRRINVWKSRYEGMG